MNIYVAGALWVLGIAGAAAAATIVARRFSHGNADGAVGGIFTIVAGVLAVLVAFVLISLFDAARSVRDGSYTEANALVAVFWASDSFPAPVRNQIQDQLRSYTRTVAEQEWPSMRDGVPVGRSGWDQLDRLRVAIDNAPVENDWQQERKSTAASQLWSVYEARQARLAAAGHTGVSAVMWIALIVGSLLSIALPYLFDVPRLATHMVIVGILAGTIALLLFSVYQLQNPFGGGANVGPDAFSSAIAQMSDRSA